MHSLGFSSHFHCPWLLTTFSACPCSSLPLRTALEGHFLWRHPFLRALPSGSHLGWRSWRPGKHSSPALTASAFLHTSRASLLGFLICTCQDVMLIPWTCVLSPPREWGPCSTTGLILVLQEAPLPSPSASARAGGPHSAGAYSFLLLPEGHFWGDPGCFWSSLLPFLPNPSTRAPKSCCSVIHLYRGWVYFPFLFFVKSAFALPAYTTEISKSSSEVP